jgi:hypothetical protein
MPERTYEIIYLTDSARTAAANIRALETAVTSLDVATTKGQASLQSLGVGNRGVTSLTNRLTGLGSTLGQVTTQAGNAGTALQGVGSGAGGAAGHVNSLGESIGGLATRMVILQELRQAWHTWLEEVKEVDKTLKSLGEGATEFRKKARELANIRGHGGPDNAILADAAGFGQETGRTPEEALKFLQAYENVGPAVRDLKHYKPTQGTPEQLEKDVTEETARTAQRIGLDDKSAAEALGAAGLSHTFTGPEQAMDILGGALEGLSKGKLEYSKGVPALNKLAAKLVDPKEAAKEGAVPGRIGGFDEAGVYMGALSLGTGTADQAQQRAIQISRALNSMKPEAQKALQQAGVRRDMTDPEKVIAMGRFLKTQDDPLEWLAKNQIGTEASREAVVAGGKQADVLDKRLGEMRQGGAGKRLIETNRTFAATDRTALAAQGDATKGALDLVEGEELELFERAKGFADQRLRVMDPKYRSVARKTFGVLSDILSYPLTGESSEEGYKEDAPGYGAIDTLRMGAMDSKIDLKDFDARYPELDSNQGLNFDYTQRARAFGRAAKEVMARGGDPFGRADLKAITGERIEGLRTNDQLPGVGANATVPAGRRPAAAPAGQPGAAGAGLPGLGAGGMPGGVNPGAAGAVGGNVHASVDLTPLLGPLNQLVSLTAQQARDRSRGRGLDLDTAADPYTSMRV